MIFIDPRAAMRIAADLPFLSFQTKYLLLACSGFCGPSAEWSLLALSQLIRPHPKWSLTA
jgi:hypothetical protein